MKAPVNLTVAYKAGNACRRVTLCCLELKANHWLVMWQCQTDTFADSRIGDSATEPAAAANKAAVNKIAKCGELANIFFFQWQSRLPVHGTIWPSSWSKRSANESLLSQRSLERVHVSVPATLYCPPEGQRGCLSGNVQRRVNAVRSTCQYL